jgi:acetolactate synthase-1/2/3 large subunit
MRVCDYIAKTLYEQYNIKHVYGLVGGGAAGLNDGFICNSNIEFVCFHHEQGAGHAAVGAARTNRKLSVVNVTTGCGGTNSLTSCLNAWQESVPVLFLSGNVRMDNSAKWINKKKGLNLRRYGAQEHDITETVKNMTKYSVMVENANDVVKELHKCINIATDGRPGPVWLDIPADIQTAIITDFNLDQKFTSIAKENFTLDLDAILETIQGAQRPVVIAGSGVTISESQSLFRKLIDKYHIPFVTTFQTRDLIEYDHAQNLGLIGVKGNRCANFAVQNSDLLLILGCSMNSSHVGYDAKTFSPHSKRIMVDIDHSELNKDIINIHTKVNCDVNLFLDTISKIDLRLNNHEWISKCSYWKTKWPVYDADKHRSDSGGINLYEVVESFNRNMKPNDVIIVDAGQPCYVCSTNLKMKFNQKYMAQAAQGDMGYAIPACVGVHKTNPSLNLIICIGEGSFYTNVQELAVIKQHNIPVKIFVINNDGYMSIKQTQDKFFNKRRYGVSKDTGVYFADISKIATAFDIKYIKLSNNQELDSHISSILNQKNPIIVEVISQDTLDVLPSQAIKPDGKQAGLHDMAPFLSEQELTNEMIVKI